MAALAVMLAAGLVASSVAGGVVTCLRAMPAGCQPFPLKVTMGVSVKPAKLPRAEMAPVEIDVEGSFQSTVSTETPALREAVVDIDRHVMLSAEGVPSCGGRQLASLDTEAARRTCRGAVVGRGVASVVLAPEWLEMEVPVTFFNGGVRDGTTTLLAHSFLDAGVAEAILARVKVVKRRVGRYGFEALVRIPPIAGGSGALRSFSFRLERRFVDEGEERSYLQARCADGRLTHRVTKLLFRNEANTPGVPPATELTGSFIAPCTPTG